MDERSWLPAKKEFSEKENFIRSYVQSYFWSIMNHKQDKVEQSEREKALLFVAATSSIRPLPKLKSQKGKKRERPWGLSKGRGNQRLYTSITTLCQESVIHRHNEKLVFISKRGLRINRGEHFFSKQILPTTINTESPVLCCCSVPTIFAVRTST